MENRSYILVPFDFRDESVMALKTGLKIGRALNYRIEVVQFVPANSSYFVMDPGIMVGYGASVSQMVREHPNLPGEDAFLGIMDELKAIHRDVHFKQIEGVPGIGPIEGLTGYIEDTAPALIVVHKDLYKDSEFVPGPIMHRLVRHNEIPVLMLEGENLTSGFKNILIPTDASGFLPEDEEFISRWVDAFDATVHLLNVIPYDGDHTSEVIRKMEAMALHMGFEKFIVDTARGNKVVDTIMKYSEKIDADLIVMKSNEKSGLQNLLFGSITEDLIKKSTQPVLAV